ncbi:uncharacterized protein FFB20_05812 [Fusarium fujikuroi]|nr:uncharacterized protein FFB20_05812 [Fusarium fujikuroi]SCO10690.1 uncharacterized protein FFC1_11176 [Fusarium fujikuroi]SCO13208.1 uncharacterized protein FFE2_12685 [Fusarium fujikuroi]
MALNSLGPGCCVAVIVSGPGRANL